MFADQRFEFPNFDVRVFYFELSVFRAYSGVPNVRCSGVRTSSFQFSELRLFICFECPMFEPSNFDVQILESKVLFAEIELRIIFSGILGYNVRWFELSMFKAVMFEFAGFGFTNYDVLISCCQNYELSIDRRSNLGVPKMETTFQVPFRGYMFEIPF